MSYKVMYTDASVSDLALFNKPIQKVIRKAIDKVALNPLPKNEGGYGTPLGNRRGNNLTGLCRIKLLRFGIRVVYQLVRADEVMKIIIIAARADNEVYIQAAKRIDKTNNYRGHQTAN